jgi:hypothetical protein
MVGYFMNKYMVEDFINHGEVPCVVYDRIFIDTAGDSEVIYTVAL